MRIIAGTFGGRTIKTVEGPGYRPAMARVRESLFSMLESRGAAWHGARVMDLFAGSGSLAFEALSRGAAEATLVEMAPQAVKCLRANAALLRLDEGRCRIVADDVLKLLSRSCALPCDVTFIDPPYGKNLLQPALRSLLRRGWLAEDALVCAEVEASLSFDAAKAHAGLELLADRNFGQTRIVIWKHIQEQ